MARYTDIEKLKTQLHRYQLRNCNNCTGIDCGMCFHFILDDAHTEDVTPVVHGLWEHRKDVPGFVRCSVCKDCNVYDDWADGKKWAYCPNCGAKMDLEDTA